MYTAEDELTRAILDAVAQPLLVIDPDGAVAHVNSAAGRALGHDDHRGLVGRSSHEALHAFHEDGSRYPADQCPIVQAAPAARTPSGREVFLDRCGNPVPVWWKVSPLPRPSYRLLAFTPDAGGQPDMSTAHRHPTPDSLRDQVASEFRDPRLTPSRLAHANHISLRTLQSVLAQANVSPAALIRSQRLHHARRLLEDGWSSSSAAFESGFADADTFARAFRRYYGVAPSAFRKQSQARRDAG